MEYLHRVYGKIAGTYQSGAAILKIAGTRRYRENFLSSGGSELLMMWMLSMLVPNISRNASNLSQSPPQFLDDRIK